MKIPILTFHKIGEVRSKYWTSKESLHAQCALLKSLGYETITMAALAADLFTTKKPCVLTFDDSYRNFKDAVPILERFGFTATVFVATGFIGGDNRAWEAYDIVPVPHLDAGEIVSLANQGFDFQPHTVHHKNFLRCTEEEQIKELVESKAALEYILGRNCDVHCYPGGGYDPEIKRRVKEAGYSMAVCCDQGVEDLATIDRYAVKRVTNYSEIV